MADEPEVIRQEMEQTRASLTEKLDALTQRTTETVESATEQVAETVETVTDAVQETVGTVQETVQGTVENVREALDLSGWVEQYPWLMMGGAAAVGFLLGRYLTAATAPSVGPEQWREPPPSERWERAGARSERHIGNGGRRPEPPEPARTEKPEEESSWLGGLAEQFAPQIDQLKGLALGATLGVVRDMITQGQPGDLGNKLSEIINGFTEKLGGTPLQGPLTGEQQEAEQQERTPAAAMDRGRMAGMETHREEGRGSRRPDRKGDRSV